MSKSTPTDNTVIKITLIDNVGIVDDKYSIDILHQQHNVGKYNDTNRYTVQHAATQPATGATQYQLSDVEVWYCACNIDYLKLHKIASADAILLYQLFSMLWQHSNTFLLRHAVYNMYRQAGYILHSGLKYGCEYVIYSKQTNNKHQHALYSVDVYDINATSQPEPYQLINKIRICASIAKTYVACYVDNTESVRSQINQLAQTEYNNEQFRVEYNKLLQQITVKPIELQRFQPTLPSAQQTSPSKKPKQAQNTQTTTQ